MSYIKGLQDKARHVKILDMFFYTVTPFASALGGYRLTEWVFRTRLVRYPFEDFGKLVGISFFFWTLALVFFYRTFFQKRRDPS